MNKAQLIEKILQTNPQLTKNALTKCKKAELEEMYNTLQLQEQQVKKEEIKEKKRENKKNNTIIEFSSFSDSETEEEVEENKDAIEDEFEEFEELPKEPPKLTRQNAMTKSVEFDDINELVALPPLQRQETIQQKPKLNIPKIKQQLKAEMNIFIEDMKNLLHDFRQTRDKDFLTDNYQIILRDQEERFLEFLESITSPDILYDYAHSLLQPHTNRINRLVR
jgi:hypothetical protein